MSPTGLRSPGKPATPTLIVGRAAERALLQEHLHLADAGHGQLVILGGEAGIGKTTLARDLALAAERRGACVLVGHCYDLTATPPYGPWRDLAADYRPTDLMPPLPPALAGQSLSDITSQAELFQQIRGFLDGIAATRLTVVILEDAHWSDPASLELLRHIGSHLTGRRLLILVTYRVDELTRQQSFYVQLPALIRETGGLRLNLRRLTARDVDELVTGAFDLPPPEHARLTGYLDQHAEGNPFFVAELLRALIDEGLLYWLGERWELRAVDRLVVSALVRQVIETRLARLGEATRGPLQVAAVIGQEIPLDLWAEMTELDDEVLLAIVERALEAHIFSATAGGTHVRFVHALTRLAIYDSILPPRRRQLHAVVAAALAARPNPNPDAVAYHFQQAGNPQAPEWMIRAGERAQRAYAWRTAWERFATAAELLRDVPGQELTHAQLLYRCGRLLRYSDAANGIASLDEASRLAEQVGAKVLVADATYSRGLLRCYADDWRLGLREMTAGIEDLEALPADEGRGSWTLVNWMADALPAIDLAGSPDIDPAADRLIAAGVNYRRGALPYFLAVAGWLAEATAVGEAFLARVQGIGAGPLVMSATGHSLFGIAMVHAALGEPDRAREELEEARAIYQRIDHHAVIAFSYLTELRDVLLPFHTADVPARQRAAAAARDALEQAGGAFLSAVLARRAELALCLLDGRWQQARATVADFPESGNSVLRREVTATLAPIAYGQGHTDQVWGYIRDLLPGGAATEPGDAVFQDGLLLQQLAAAMLLDAGRLDDARAWLAANDRWLAWSGAVRGRVESRILWARLAMLRGAEDTAHDLADEALAAASSPEQPLALIAARCLAGTLATRAGHQAEAIRALESAVELAAACGAVYPHIRARIALAEHLLRTGAEDTARSLLTEAATDSARLGAAPASRRIAELLASLAPTAHPDAENSILTAREREVLGLVAQGLTDAEVAERLYISPRTVGQHLRSVYSKLEVTSRAGATRYAVEHHLS